MLTLFLACALSACCVGTKGQTGYVTRTPVQWSDVPAVPPTTTNLTQNCVCDITVGVCNMNCCCDVDCVSNVTALFEQQFCLPPGEPAQEIQYCSPSSPYLTVNLPVQGNFFNIFKVEPPNTFMRQLLCVRESQNIKLGKNYADDQPGPTSINKQIAACSPQSTATSELPTAYYYNTPIIARPSASSASTAFQLPYPAFNMVCQDNFEIGFLQALPYGDQEQYSYCVRTLPFGTLEGACTSSSVLSAQTFTQIVFAANPSADPQLVADVLSLQLWDSATGRLTTLNTTTGNVPVPLWDADTSTCSNVLLYMTYTMVYSSIPSQTSVQGTLEQVHLSLILTDVIEGSGSSTSSTSIKIGVAVRWVAMSNSSVLVVHYSGNPGYIPGFPVLAGLLTRETPGDDTSSAAISRFVEGLPTAGPLADSACSPAGLVTVRYGFNASSSCNVILTYTQLAALCSPGQSGDIFVQSALGADLYSNITAGLMYLGIYGNSQFNNVADWVQLLPQTQDTRQTILTNRSCSDVMTGMEYIIVTGLSGSEVNPVRQVLYAVVCFTYGTFTIPDRVGNNTPYLLTLNFSVTFRALVDQDTYYRQKPHPPLVAYFPSDTLYPFSAYAPSTAVPLAVPMVIGIVIMCVILQSLI